MNAVKQLHRLKQMRLIHLFFQVDNTITEDVAFDEYDYDSKQLLEQCLCLVFDVVYADERSDGQFEYFIPVCPTSFTPSEQPFIQGFLHPNGLEIVYSRFDAFAIAQYILSCYEREKTIV